MITGTILAEDYINAQRLHRAGAARWIYAATAVAVILGIGLLIFYDQGIGMTVAGAGIGGAIGELIMSRIFIPRAARRIYRQQKEGFSTPATIEWDNEFLKSHSIYGDGKRPWTHFVKFKEDEKMFLLYRADNLFNMIPKSWFQDQEQMDEFRSLACQVTDPTE